MIHPPLLAIGAHPDDIEFAIGALIARESASGRECHFLLLSKGEAATNGTTAQRTREAQAAAQILGAKLHFLKLSGDAHLKPRTEFAIKLAGVIRQLKPATILAPTTLRNQHPDHAAAGTLAQTAARLARYGGVRELKKLPPHSISALFFYAITPDAEPKDTPPIFIDVSDPQLLETWTRAMQAHASQMKTRNYLDLQLTRARLNGLRCPAPTTHAVPLFANDPLLFNSLSQLPRTARHF